MTAGKLVLGGAQFGMAYGLTNTAGMPSKASMKALLDVASTAGIDLIDTAPAYGESEKMLGQLQAGERFGIVTKALHRGTTASTATLTAQLQGSLARLKQPAIEGLLFHEADVLLSDSGQALFDEASRLKADGLFSKIGVSVYDAEQIDAVMARYSIDIVQLPINLLDKRLLLTSALDRLKSRGVEVHARSVFLQGVLLADPRKLPAKVTKLRPAVLRFHQKLDGMDLSPLQACLGFLNGMDTIDRIIVGVTTQAELEEILTALHTIVPSTAFADIAIDDPELLDPRFWS